MHRQKLLLVDDDALVLKGLRRGLRMAGWDVVTADSIPEAISLAETAPPDVALVDVLMPDGGAIGFFTGLRDRGIQTPMVMMSGARAILQVAKKSLRSSVLLIEKPFSADEATKVLHMAIDTAECRPKAQLTLAQKIDDVLATATKGTSHIPSLDPTLAAAIPLIRSPTIKIETLSGILQQDAAATMAILRAANSAAYAGNRRIATIEDAIVRIGQTEIAELVMQVTIKRVLALKRAPFAAWGRQLWQRSVATACAARALAAYLPNQSVNPMEAYTAGLLHDVGEAVCLCAIAQSRLPVTAVDIAGPFTAYHEAMGALTLNHWGIPSPLPQLAGRHHAPAIDAEHEPMRQLLWAADTVADSAGYVGLGKTPPTAEIEEVAIALGLTVSQLDNMTTEITERTQVG